MTDRELRAAARQPNERCEETLLLVWCEDNSVILEVLNLNREEEKVLAGGGGEQAVARPVRV